MALEAGSVYAVLGGKFMPTGFAQFDAAMKKSSASAAAAEAQIGRSSGRSAAAMGALGTAARTGAAAGLLAVGVAAVSSVKSAQTFQKQMSELKAVTEASAQQMGVMRKAALDLGASTGIGATKAAQALTELAKGGLDTERSIGALKGTIALAQAGGLDLATAGETVANALNLFKLRGEDATMVADNFANAANATTADVGFFAQGLAQGGAAAKAAGLSFQETTVFLEAMAANGFKSGSDAGTSMKTALIQLANPTARAKEAAKQLGVAFYDSNGAMRPLPAIAKDLGNAFDGMSKKEKLATATRLVGTDGMRALLALADQGPAKLKGFADANAQTGAAARVAAEKMNNYEGASQRLAASFESLKIQAGTALLPVLADAADALANFFNQMRTGQGVGGTVAKVFRTIGLALGSLVGSSSAMSKFSQLLPEGFSQSAVGVLGAVRAMIVGFGQLAVVASRIPGPMQAAFKGAAGAARMALDDIDKVTGALRDGIDKKRTLRVIADTKQAKRAIEEIHNSQFRDKVQRILGSNQDAKQKIRAITDLGIPEKIARILVQSGSARQAIENLRQKIASLQNKNITITTTRREVVIPGRGRALGRAAGRGPGAAETALVGEGGGPEYVVDAATGLSRRVDSPTFMSLSDSEYVIPTESKYRGRALGLIAELAADMGIVGYKAGRLSKKQRERLKKKQEQKRNAEDRRIGIADTNAGRYGTEMDTANLDANGRGAFDTAKTKRLQQLAVERRRAAAALRRAKRGSQRYAELNAKVSEIDNAIARTRAEVFTGPPAADVLTGLSDAERAQIESADMQIALAALTAGAGDDQAALAAKESVLAGMLLSGQLTGRTQAITDVAGQLRSTRDELANLSGGSGTPGVSADQQAISEQTMNRERIAAQSAFIDRLVGATIGGAGNTLVFQSYVPPSPTEAKRLADYTVGGIGYQGGIPSSTDRIGV